MFLQHSGHHIENTADTGLVFLETFASDEFQDVSLNQWLRRMLSEIIVSLRYVV
jgi:oxalate decarboxylase